MLCMSIEALCKSRWTTTGDGRAQDGAIWEAEPAYQAGWGRTRPYRTTGLWSARPETLAPGAGASQHPLRTPLGCVAIATLPTGNSATVSKCCKEALTRGLRLTAWPGSP
ncbi:hypothetical protein Acsp03_62540 [Actinomadura sp. NBRC 104412]|nr:hypothetical protein Acsp03_62540 [Actinomadura sp. NBRC 104412]